MDTEIFPYKPGDWVQNSSDTVAKVKDVWSDQGKVLLDLILYTWRGDKVGRESPALGGPRTFEPACDPEGWRRVAKPNFPLQAKWVPNPEGGFTGRLWAGDTLPPANWSPRKRKVCTYVPTSDDRLRKALEEIANGHNDARGLAKKVLGYE